MIRPWPGVHSIRTLYEEAIIAIREWRFTPGRIADTPVEVLLNLLLDFRIS
jgi:hypothetical protein